jgi:hypothetical protein
MTADVNVGRRVYIKSGTGAGQWRRITANTTSTITVEYAWTVTPDATSVFEIIKTNVCMCVSVGDVGCAYNTVVKTSTSGTFTAANNLKLFPVGTRDESWTLLFSSSTAFSITGAYIGNVAGSYNINGVARPANGSSYYFEIATGAWGGTFQAGDTVTFNTVSASKSVWIKETVPAACSPHLANSVDIGVSGDTV